MVPSTQHIPLGGHRMPRKESLASFSQPDQDRRIMAAWERFLQNGALASSAVRRLIERSWERCRAAGIDPVLTQAAAPLLDEELTALRSRYRDLLEASVPIMAQAREILSESGTIMILTDPSGVILQTEGDPATVDAARLIRLQIGANWHELACGTNAIGMALSVGRPVQVHAAEHFCAGIKPWTCSATVVRDPARGEVIGVVDVSGLSRTFHRDFLALAVMTAGRIEAQLSARQMELRQYLLETGMRRLSRLSSGGLLFFDRRGRLLSIDTAAGRSLAAMGIRLDSGDDAVSAFSADLQMRAGSATLPEWLRPEWVEPVVRGGERLGTIVVLPELSQGRTGRRALHSPAATLGTGGESSGSVGPIIGGSEALRNAAEKARLLANLDVPVLLQGETGGGKG